MSELIREAVEEHWGERCPDYDDTCAVCRAWSAYDALLKPKVLIELHDIASDVQSMLSKHPAVQGREHIDMGSRFANAIARAGIALHA